VEAKNRPRLRQQLTERDGEICAYCGKLPEETKEGYLTIDRKEPGGSYSLENCQYLCNPCNASKGTLPPELATKTVRHVNAREQAGYTVVQNCLLLNTSVSMGARFLFILMKQYAWQDESCWPGQ